MNTEIIRTLVKHNRAWGKAVKSINPSFFINQANIQVPLAMVIGCSDSRVPFTTISDSAPGDLFTLRNIANVISENDQCLNTCKIVNKIVLQYGLDHLKLSNIIVVGHYNCGGVSLAADLSKENNRSTDIDTKTWLEPIVSLIKENDHLLNNIGSTQKKNERICELHCANTLLSLSKHSAITKKFNEGKVNLYGLLYDPAKGRISKFGFSLNVDNAKTYNIYDMNIQF